jgi:hypothetical protein
VFFSIPTRETQRKYFRMESEELSRWGEWVKKEAPGMVSELHIEEKGKDSLSYVFYPNWVPREGGRPGYQSYTFFTVPNVPIARVSFGGIFFDSEFIRDKYLPKMLNQILTKK